MPFYAVPRNGKKGEKLLEQLDHDPLKNEKLSRKLEERDLIPWNCLFTYYY